MCWDMDCIVLSVHVNVNLPLLACICLTNQFKSSCVGVCLHHVLFWHMQLSWKLSDFLMHILYYSERYQIILDQGRLLQVPPSLPIRNKLLGENSTYAIAFCGLSVSQILVNLMSAKLILYKVNVLMRRLGRMQSFKRLCWQQKIYQPTISKVTKKYFRWCVW